MSKTAFKAQQKLLEVFAGKLEEFYLAGGTALALFYFRHRLSEDLDFFTQQFERTRVIRIIEKLEGQFPKKTITLEAEQSRPERARMMIYHVHWAKKEFIKIDFVEDFLKLIKPLKMVDYIPVLSLEDIFLRKIFAITGAFQATDQAGRKQLLGGRQEAKDFYDLYCLSHTFMPLSKFAIEYCDAVRQEGMIHWFHTYDRFEMKTGLLDLKTNEKTDYREIERHFKNEIDRLVDKGIGL